MEMTKVRWNRCTNDYKEELEVLLTSEEEELAKGLEAKARAVFDSDRGVITMGIIKSTVCKGNQRTYLPEARPAKEEAELVMRQEAWKEVIYNIY